MPRRSLAVLIVALLAAAGCSSGSDEPTAKPGITGTSAVKHDLELDLVGAAVVSPHQNRFPLDARDQRQAVNVVQKVFDATVVDSLRTGKGGSVKPVLTADALQHATGADRGAVFDEGFAPLPKLVGTKTDVQLTALAGDDGNPAVLIAKIDWNVRSADRAVQVHRIGELTLVPAFGTWVVGAYTLLVGRTAGGETTTTRATSP